MSKSGRAAYDAQQQDRGADNYMAEEGERRHDIDQRITALEDAAGTYPNTVFIADFQLQRFKKAATELTEYLRENGYPKQPEPTQSEDIPF